MVNGSDIIGYAKQFIGVPYVSCGTTPKGFDCSGLVQYVYRHFGINISRTTRTQINDGREVGRNNLQLGDLVFPSSGHVTLYIGNNQVLHAPEPGDRVKISPLWKFWRARRILPDENRNPTPNPTPVPIPKNEKIKPGTFTLHTSTALHRTDDNFEFLVGDYNHNGRPDVYCIKKNGTGSGKTEVHILNGENNYQNFLLQTPTALHETDGNWQFCLGDYNHNGCLDLYCIAKRNTGSHSTEVHILSGKSNFSKFILHTGTILHETDENWKFCLGDYNNNGCLDLYCIPRRNTGSKSTEVHVLSGKENFQKFLLHTGTKLHETDENWDFGLSGKNLCCIAKRGTGTRTTEVHISNGNNNFQDFLLQTGTDLHETGKDFCFYAYGDTLFAFSKNGASNSTEVHCLSIQL